MKNPMIALLTDFGEEDFFVGSLKGVITTINPSAPILDITHHVPPFDALAGGFILYAVYTYYPSGTIFLMIVDPGVGSARRILLIETDEYMFIAPDNGMLSMVLDSVGVSKIINITNPKYFLPEPSLTFEGRDKMAPVAAWLSKGVAPSEFGREISDCVRIDVQKPRIEKGGVIGQILYVDKFGNLITNVPTMEVNHLLERDEEKKMICRVGREEIARFEQSYSFVNKGELLFLPGSLGLIEIAMREGSAKEKLAAHPGDTVRIALE